jgi:hypothetical protein
MSEATKPSVGKGSDWTRLLTDPDLVSHLGHLLRTYREVAPEMREAALLKAMHEIKDAAVKAREAANRVPAKHASANQVSANQVSANQVSGPAEVYPQPEMESEMPHPEPIDAAPPFEPDLFAQQAGLDRRRYQRIKCFVAVEIHVEGVDEPVWGNLSNVSRGGCLVETASAVPAGKVLEIGLWVASGKIWVKGVILSGVVTRSTPSFGVRVKFSEAELAEKEHLREFLKFVDSTTRKAQSGHAYVAKLRV